VFIKDHNSVHERVDRDGTVAHRVKLIKATKEGILRNDRMLPKGRIWDAVLYSLIQKEWTEVKTNLANI
jgi:N-acetyltransferase